MNCQSCRQENRAGRKFCAACGARLGYAGSAARVAAAAERMA
jgi:hypothetical protein